jgi:hypothetical protein
MLTHPRTLSRLGTVLVAAGWIVRLTACGYEDCPQGTIPRGALCLRFVDAGEPTPSDESSTSAAQRGADQPSAPSGSGAAGNRAAAGGGGKDASDGSSSDAPPDEPMDNASDAAGRDASAGRSAASTAAGTSGNAGAHAAAGASDSGTAPARPAAAGSGGVSSGGRGGAGAAGTKPTPAGSGAAGTPASSPSGDWLCANFDVSCTCVQGQGLDSDMCATPKPTCCFLLVAAGMQSCQCWPDESAECADSKASNFEPVHTCPP